MKVSIVTAVFNGARVIEDCVRSVLTQSYKDIEYIIIDGGSKDGTCGLIERYGSSIAKIISEPDEGIYDALNKGIRVSGGDAIGFLHADDCYANEHVISKVVSCLKDSASESCYGDLLYVDRVNLNRVVRHWKSRPYKEGLFRRGWMPPHPTFFVKKGVYEKFGCFDTGFRIAADYELMLRFLVRHRVSTCYIPEVLIRMRWGGTSNKNIKNMMLKTREDYRAWKVNGLRRPFYTIPLKNITKIPQFLRGKGDVDGVLEE